MVQIHFYLSFTGHLYVVNVKAINMTHNDIQCMHTQWTGCVCTSDYSVFCLVFSFLPFKQNSSYENRTPRRLNFCLKILISKFCIKIILTWNSEVFQDKLKNKTFTHIHCFKKYIGVSLRFKPLECLLRTGKIVKTVFTSTYMILFLPFSRKPHSKCIPID